MEFDFDISTVLTGRVTSFLPPDFKRLPPVRSSAIRQIVDTMGRLSAEAQGLPTVITTYTKFCEASDQRLYLMREGKRVVGLLKVGSKDLFLHDIRGRFSEHLHLPSLLDFFVHGSQQRRGYGLQLFDFMLKDVNSASWLSSSKPLPASGFAYDRPSAKLLGFLAKHFDLKTPINQNNHYVVFPEFFHDSPSTERRRHGERGYETRYNGPAGRAAPARSRSDVGRTRADADEALLRHWAPPLGILPRPASNVYSRFEYPSQDRSTRRLEEPSLNAGTSTGDAASGGKGVNRAPFACHVDWRADGGTNWRSASNKRFQRTALW